MQDNCLPQDAVRITEKWHQPNSIWTFKIRDPALFRTKHSSYSAFTALTPQDVQVSAYWFAGNLDQCGQPSAKSRNVSLFSAAVQVIRAVSGSNAERVWQTIRTMTPIFHSKPFTLTSHSDACQKDRLSIGFLTNSKHLLLLSSTKYEQWCTMLNGFIKLIATVRFWF